MRMNICAIQINGFCAISCDHLVHVNGRVFFLKANFVDVDLFYLYRKRFYEL